MTRAVPGVEISVTEPAPGVKIRTVVTDNNGNYEIPDVKPGTYRPRESSQRPISPGTPEETSSSIWEVGRRSRSMREQTWQETPGCLSLLQARWSSNSCIMRTRRTR